MTKPIWRQWIEAVVVALFLAVILRNFLFGLYHVPSGSAEPTILVGDRIWGNKMAYYFQQPQRGDLVIFDNPEFSYTSTNILVYWWQRYVGMGIPFIGIDNGPDNWVKRVIAGPGDVIEGRVENDKTVIYINGKVLDEPYVNQYPLIRLTKTTGFIDADYFGPFAIPSFLRFMQKQVRYSYDPSKILSQQPFYCMTEDETVKNFETSRYILDLPYSPSYRFDVLSKSCVDIFGPFTIPAGKYWVMGDSRKNSRDSRFWLFLDEKLIHGRASFIIWSLDSEETFWLFDFIKHPLDFVIKHVRWTRIFKGFQKYDVAKN
jgi:signal peptidase I